MYCSQLFLTCLVFTLPSRGEQLDCSRRPDVTTKTSELKFDLLCGYDKFSPPAERSSNKTWVDTFFAPITMNFDDAHSTFHVEAWSFMFWTDKDLKWNKSKYSGIDRIELDSSNVWVPDVFLVNAKNDDTSKEEVDNVIIHSNGLVFKEMTPDQAGHCFPTWDNWPYDVHVCTITLGSRGYNRSMVEFRFLQGYYLADEYVLSNKYWKLLDYKTFKKETPLPLRPKKETDSLLVVTLNYQFTLKRHSSVFVANCVIPGMVMILLSLGVLWIHSQRIERTLVICALIILHTIYLQYFAYKIPSNGDSTPFIVCFYRDSLALTCLLLIETLLTRSMTRSNSNPAYLKSTFDFVARNKYLHLILSSRIYPKNAGIPMEAADVQMSAHVTTGCTQQWQLLAEMVDKMCFILLVPTYVILSFRLMPFN